MNAPPMSAHARPDRFLTADAVLWEATWAGLGIRSAPRDVFDLLRKRYDERHRAYHTREHLEHCFSLLVEARERCEYPDEVALALWFHDAIYEPLRSDNEAASAGWLVEVARAAGVVEPSVERMHALVMATRHDAPAQREDERILVDIDLAILGSSPQRFEAYESQIRREYRWVPGAVYRAGRARILQAFLDRPAIYATAPFHVRFEHAARTNIMRSLELLARR
ncbi:HD domain-containing protein [Dyella sp. 2RAB6]|uniref:HD domain-containing protein n=1 Tax=Dyella sp. 2RAB6 TaxID=3232992 RepID=UPI003F9154D1